MCKICSYLVLRNKVTGGWKKWLKEELHNLYFLPNLIRMIKSRIMRWAGYVGYMGEMRTTKFWLESLMGTDHLEDVGIDGRIMIKWILEK
jgi:hypothetical protein